MKEKMTPHIIAVGTLVVFIVLGLACASDPEFVYLDKSVPKEQSATLYLDSPKKIASIPGLAGWPIFLNSFNEKHAYGKGADTREIIIPAGIYSLANGTQVVNVYTGETMTYDSSVRGDGTFTRTTSDAYYQRIVYNINSVFQFEPGKIYNVSATPIPVYKTNKNSIYIDENGNFFCEGDVTISFLEGAFYRWEFFVNEINEIRGEFIKNIPIHESLVYYRKGYYNKVIKNYDTAITCFDQAIQLFPDYANAFLQRGHTYHQKGNYDLAIADFNQMIKLYPNNINGYNYRGYTYLTKKDYDLAIADFNTALKIDKDNTIAKNYLKEAKEEKKKQKK